MTEDEFDQLYWKAIIEEEAAKQARYAAERKAEADAKAARKAEEDKALEPYYKTENTSQAEARFGLKSDFINKLQEIINKNPEIYKRTVRHGIRNPHNSTSYDIDVQRDVINKFRELQQAIKQTRSAEKKLDLLHEAANMKVTKGQEKVIRYFVGAECFIPFKRN